MESELTKKLAARLKGLRLDRDIRVMEVCGTHTTEFFRTGVKDLFPPGLELIDGPGCPVCVTPNDYLDRAIEIGKRHRPVIATFGDMVKVPSSYSSLAKEKAGGHGRPDRVFAHERAGDGGGKSGPRSDVPERGVRDHGAGRGG